MNKLTHLDVLHIIGNCTINAIKTADSEMLSNPLNAEIFYKGVMSGIAAGLSQTGILEEMKKCDNCNEECGKCRKRQANLFRTAYAYLMLTEEEKEVITKEAYNESEKIKAKMKKEKEADEIKDTILKTGKFL